MSILSRIIGATFRENELTFEDHAINLTDKQRKAIAYTVGTHQHTLLSNPIHRILPYSCSITCNGLEV